jgi:heme-degrading monooxygenase HmoA
MQKILIDKFIVPEESKAPFLERAHHVQSILRTLPGFVEGFLYEKGDGESRYNYMTTVVWEKRGSPRKRKEDSRHGIRKARFRSSADRGKTVDGKRTG